MTDRPAAVPRWHTPRRHDRPTWGPRVAEVATALGRPLMPWQRALADVALEVDPTGRLAYRRVIVTVPRQSGKTSLLLPVYLQRMIDAAAWGGRQSIVHTAQSRNAARKKLVEDFLPDLEASTRLRGRWSRRLSNGSEQVLWQGGSRLGIEAPTETAGHGQTIDLAGVDEAFALVDDRVEQALSPAMITRPSAQTWIVSTAGTPERSTYLRAQIDAGRAAVDAGVDAGVCFVEYSAADDADPADESQWWRCMPALGRTVPVEAVRAELASMTTSGFARAFLNRWVSDAGDSPIPLDAWAECADPDSTIVGTPLAWAADVSPASSAASIAVAGRTADGAVHVEVVEVRDGDAWVVERLVELAGRHGHAPVVLDPTGPSAALIGPAQDTGLDVVVTGARDMTAACSGLLSATLARSWRHIGQGVLDEALQGAATRDLLDAWAWRRRTSRSDISPLVAVTLAHWAAARDQPASEVI